MATFPFTFPYAGRTFSVVTDGPLESEPHARSAPRAVRRLEAEAVYVRIIGIRGLHDFGSVDPGEPNGRLRERICRWYDSTYAAALTRPVAEEVPADERSRG
jgi:hypothetical protein